MIDISNNIIYEIGDIGINLLQSEASSNRPQAAAGSAGHKVDKKSLIVVIRLSKQRYWTKLCQDVDFNLWGRLYQMVTRELGGWVPASNAAFPVGTITAILDALLEQELTWLSARYAEQYSSKP